MGWWGKIIGGYLGFQLGGTIGAVLGVLIGHSIDRAVYTVRTGGGVHNSADNERIQLAFFTATFSVMGHIAKADGKVSKDEIRHAEAVMTQMQLNEQMRKTAIKLFNEGKQADFDIDMVLVEFKQVSGRRTNLYRMFLEIQIQAAFADGTMDQSERAALLHISKALGFPEFVFRQLEAFVKASMGSGGYQQAGSQQARTSNAMSSDEAYSMLGISSESTKTEAKRAYRKLISQHHPDKLVAKGLPEEMIKLANEKTAKITKAYDLIKQIRGW